MNRTQTPVRALTANHSEALLAPPARALNMNHSEALVDRPAQPKPSPVRALTNNHSEAVIAGARSGVASHSVGSPGPAR